MVSSDASPTPRPNPESPKLACPYCGDIVASAPRCSSCRGYLDLLSRQATQNQMGSWWLLADARRALPGRAYASIRALALTRRLSPDSVIRGPTTHQFWTLARDTPGVAHLLGICHACHAPVDPGRDSCPGCGVSFLVDDDRDRLGLGQIRLLPGHADAASVAAAALGGSAGVQPPLPGPAPDGAAPSGEDLPMLRRKPARRRRLGGLLILALCLGLAGIAGAAWALWPLTEPAEVAADSRRSADAIAPPEIPATSPDPITTASERPRAPIAPAPIRPEGPVGEGPAPAASGLEAFEDLSRLTRADAQAFLDRVRRNGAASPQATLYIEGFLSQAAFAEAL